MALLFFDLDGTILINGKVVPGILETMAALKANGHKIAIATGRNPNLLNGIDQYLKIDQLVLANGGYVLSQGKVIHENYISLETLKGITKKADELPFDLTIEYIDEYINYRQDTEASLKFSQHFNLPLATYDPKLYLGRPVFAMVMYEDLAVEKIKNEFPELQFNKADNMAFDVNPRGDLKAEGVRILMDYLGYHKADTYAFGDNYNDILMLKAVGHGVAMGNAVDALKNIAEYVTDNVDQLGIEKALKHYHLL